MCSFLQLVSGFRRPLIELGTGFDLVHLALEDSLGCMWWHGYDRSLMECNQIGLVCMWLHGYGKHDMNVKQIGLKRLI